MTRGTLVWGNLWRRKLRTTFTTLSIVVAFLLFGLLAAVRAAFSFGVQTAGTDTLMMFQKVSLARPLPLAYQTQIARTPGVAGVTHATWFGGTYQDRKTWFPQLAVDAPAYLDMHPDYRLAPDRRRAWFGNRTGCIVGRDIANRFGWRVGDRIPLRRAGSSGPAAGVWVFTIEGIYDAGRAGADLSQMFFHYEYFNESRSVGRDTVGWYVIRVADSEPAGDVAARLDAQFANSADATRTATTKAFLHAWANQIGDIGALVIAIAGAVLFTMLLVTTNTMAQAFSERTSELAVLKALGFSNRGVLGLVLSESLALCATGGAAGLGLAWLLIAQGDPTGGLLPAFYLPIADLVTGSVLVLTVGVMAGALPAWRAGRLRIADALRR